MTILCHNDNLCVTLRKICFAISKKKVKIIIINKNKEKKIKLYYDKELKE